MIYPLAFICTSFLSGAFLAAMSDFKEAYLFMLLTVVALLTAAVIIRKSKGVLMLFCLVAFFSGAIYTYAYGAIHIMQINDCYNADVNVSGKVTDINSNGFVLKLESVNDKNVIGKININVLSFDDVSCNAGDEVSLNGTLRNYKSSAFAGGFNASKYNMSNKVYGSIIAKNIEVTKQGTDLFYDLRRRISDNITAGFSNDKGEFLKALLIGDKSGFSETLKSNLMKSSLSHVAVVSGLHLSILISFAGIFAAFLKRHKVIYVAVMLAFLGLFVGIIGQHPSVLRAVIMATYCIVAVFLNKRYDAFTALTFSAFLLVIANPFNVQSVSFQLSYAATFAIIITMNKEGKHVFLTTLSVFLITLPLCMYYFNFASLAMFFTNLIITPVVSVLLPLGYLMQIFPFLHYVVDFLLELMLLVIEAFGSFEILNIKAAVPSIPLLVAMYSAIGGFLSIIIFGRRKTACVFVSVALLAFALGAVQPDSYVKVFNDGDNVVHIKSSKGKDIICTSGYDNIESYVNKMNIECIDALVLTKLPSNYDFKNINIKKIYAPKYDDKKISGNFSVKYYDTDVIIIDGVTITPVSFAPYRSKVDEKRPVLHINNGKKSILFEPYANDELNERYLSQLDADIVVLKHGASIKKPYEVVVGSGLQQTENMLYYDIEKCGSIIFYDDKTKTLR